MLNTHSYTIYDYFSQKQICHYVFLQLLPHQKACKKNFLFVAIISGIDKEMSSVAC